MSKIIEKYLKIDEKDLLNDIKHLVSPKMEQKSVKLQKFQI